MSQRVIHRPARTRTEQYRPAPVQLIPPPTPPETGGSIQGAMQILMPVMGGAGSLIMIVSNRNPVMLIAGGIMLGATILGALAMFVGQRTGAARKAADLRRRYLDHLDRVRGDLSDSTARQRDAALLHHPDPDLLPEIARDPARIWERRPGDPDFLVVRVGTGPAPLWSRVAATPVRDPLAEPDIVTAAAVHRIVERDRMVGGMPIGLPISGRVSVVGAPAEVRRVMTAALAQLVTLHGPEEVRLLACVPRSGSRWLDRLKWLPHALSTEEVDGVAPARLAAARPEELMATIGPEIARRVGEATRTLRSRQGDPSRFGPALVLLVDGLAGTAADPLSGIPADLDPAGIGVHVLTLVPSPHLEPRLVDVRLTVGDGGVQVQDLRPPDDHDDVQAARVRAVGAAAGVPDEIADGVLDGLVRELTAVRLVEERGPDEPLAGTLSLGDLVGVQDPGDFDVAATWRPRSLPDFLRVPFGLGPSGERVHLDIKEPALGGMGPHGLCVGATGSGKSEVLRTVVLSLAMSHPPERLAMVLVDYKGGATFAGLEDLPHCAAMISNLSDDTGLVDRLHDALFGEMKRRQQVLAAAGNLPNVTEYNRRRDAGEPMEPLPNLFVVIDEFGELLTAKPDFIELFLAIGRIGRSIGVHLLLASQRLEEGRLRGLESFLSYRLGLRTFNVNESRSVLGVPDAYELPPIPGSGYLKVDTTVFQRFKAAYVSGVYTPPVTGETEIDIAPVAAPFPLFNDTAAYLAAVGAEQEAARPAAPVVAEDVLAPSVLDVAVRRLAEAGNRVAQIWLPPLPSRLPLDEVAGPVVPDPVLGLRFGASLPGVGRFGGLRIPIGLLDRPADQRQEPYVLDLGASGGHLAILGAPQSGKSVLLRSMVISAALTHQPGEISFYCVDLGGGSLRVLEGLPHVAGVAPRMDADRVRRTIAEVATALAEREQLFSRWGIDSVEEMRDRFRAGRLHELDVADIVLVVDNYPVLRSDFEDLADLLLDLATRGPGYGIHLVLTSGRWADIRMQLQAALGSKVELRVNDPGDSTVSRKAAANLRADTPGRALVADALQVQVCLPELAGGVGADPGAVSDLSATAEVSRAVPGGDGSGAAGAVGGTSASATEQLVADIAAAWPGAPVPAIRMLPTLVDQAELRVRAGERAGVVIGVDETELKPVELDTDGADRHILLLGDAESGKTSFLRLLVSDLIARRTDDEVVFAVFDIRRTLLDVVPEDYLGAYAGTAAAAAGMAGGVAGELRKRLPPDDVTAAQLRSRSWWKGPEIYVLVDDYDLLASGGPGPLAPFLEFLPQARDIGFHMVLCRRSGGAGRALYEPVLQRLREVGATGLLLSGDRQEGAIFPGVHLSVQPTGRGTLVRRGRKPQLLQLGYLPEPS
ncbi:type VII secretion protein EccCa [Nakamurella sp. YIM 132087]|uniref:Type VII secretion protein EccCa n=1 Tax=Nakamurella alba TaxID=2665158 RepID=A0A7K1FM68_9ACTN|nr:type VII secretion protein EccCa [Nakamurella alba]MTD15251.1 type VII secretion protein EccCa [Nakamurella alba]